MRNRSKRKKKLSSTIEKLHLKVSSSENAVIQQNNKIVDQILKDITSAAPALDYLKPWE